MVIDSPGGDPAACYEIHHMLRSFCMKHNITLVAYLSSIACSGGYYIALAADEIIANPEAIVGSVGAIGYVYSYVELLRKLGIDIRIVKSGEFKDVGAPYKEISEQDIKILHRIIKRVHKHFIEILLERRGEKIRKSNLTDVINAMIYLGDEALEIGLVDHVGSLDYAIEVAKKLAGLPEDAPVVEVKPRTRTSLLPFIPSSSAYFLLELLGQVLAPLSPFSALRVLYLP